VTPAPDALTLKGRATRERIVAAAAELMHAQGVAVTSIEEVKAAAGVSSSQLYHYFADKRALVDAVLAHQIDQVLAIHEPLLAALDAPAGLRAWRDAIVALSERFGAEGGCPLGSLASELSDRDAGLRTGVAAGFDRWEASIRIALERMRERGTLRADADTAALATGVLAALQGGLLLAQVRRGPGPLAAALDLAIDRIAAAAS
jgi:AcrR family transcriptional regulator